MIDSVWLQPCNLFAKDEKSGNKLTDKAIVYPNKHTRNFVDDNAKNGGVSMILDKVYASCIEQLITVVAII
jgi:hypothetical protein